MDLEVIIKIAASLLTFVGSSAALIWKVRTKKRQREQEFDALIDAGLRDFGEEQAVKSFLRDCKRERLFERIVGVPVVQQEIVPLAEFRSDGRVRLSLIREAWSYRTIEEGNLIFRLSKPAKAYFMVCGIFFFLCGLIAIASSVLEQYAVSRSDKISFLVITIVMVIMMPVPVVLTRAEQAVRSIQSKKKQG